MKAVRNALKGVQYHNNLYGESLYSICRKATSRHIDRPDEILNQQVGKHLFLAELSAACLSRAMRGWEVVAAPIECMKV